MVKKKTTKKVVRKSKAKSTQPKEEFLKARLEEEVNALAKNPAKQDSPLASLSPDKQKIRQELLEEIAASEHPQAAVSAKALEPKPKAQPEPAPTKPALEEKTEQENLNQPEIKAPVEKVELKTRLNLRRFHKKLWILLPLIALMLYGGFYVLRLDKVYPAAAAYLPWPAAVVNGKIIWWDELNRETDLVKKFEITTKPENLAFNHLIEEEIISSYFSKYNLDLPASAIAEQLNALAAEFGSAQAFADYLQANYQLTTEGFSRYILSPYLRRLTLQEYLSHSPKESSEAEAKAREIKQSIDNNEISFDEAARRYSDDVASAQEGGSLGWFTWGAMIPEFEAALRSLEVGQISNPVRSAYGYHLIRLDEVDGQRPTNHADTTLGSVKASHIFVLVFNFDSWLETQKKTLSKVLLMPLKD